MAVRRMAGIRFDVSPPALPEALPRMDIAVFVGFAATGPLHVPVPVESVPEFDNVFGPDAPLAWDPLRGERLRAHLGPSVRAFFANGGQRCWVVRVAMTAALRQAIAAAGETVEGHDARANRFVLDGMLAASATPGGGVALAPALASARCEGSWSDGLLVQTALQERGIPLEVFDALHEGAAVRATPLLAAGDLVRFQGEDGLEVFVPLRAAPDGSLALGRAAAFRRLDAAPCASPPDPDCWTFGADAWQSLGGYASASAAAFHRAAALTFDLRVKRRGDVGLARRELGLAPGHPREWNATVVDHRFFSRDAASAAARPGLGTRFPLAAHEEALEWTPAPAGGATAERWLIPLGVGADFGTARGPEPIAGEPLERDGIDAFSGALFLDPRMRDTAALVELADFLRYTGPRPRALFGLHAALGFHSDIAEEATILCLPDAVHPGWSRTQSAPPAHEPGPPAPAPDERLFRDCAAGEAPAPAAGEEPAPGPATIDWHVRPEPSSDIVRLLHAEAMRLAASTGHLFAVLSLPASFDRAAAVAHAEALRTAVRDTAAHSYAALYHPWPIARRDDGTLFAYPPDGPAAGVLAARALARGAWIAPANEVLLGFVALQPAVRAEDWPALLDAQVNTLRREARGFVTLSEDTLAADAQLRPICVRRLLILLRRLALRRGANYVFEPNDEVFRRLVHRAFSETLAGLFARGAFAGRTPAQSFQVVTDETLNTRQSVEAGRFLVDLKVAPSLPMSFLTVRLRQVGERLTVSEAR